MIPSQKKTVLAQREENVESDLKNLAENMPENRKEDFKKLLKARDLLNESGFNYWLIPFFPTEDGEEFNMARIFNSYDNFLKFDENQELTPDSLIDVICFNTSLFKIVVKTFFPEFLDDSIDNAKKFVEFTQLMAVISDEGLSGE